MNIDINLEKIYQDYSNYMSVLVYSGIFIKDPYEELKTAKNIGLITEKQYNDFLLYVLK